MLSKQPADVRPVTSALTGLRASVAQVGALASHEMRDGELLEAIAVAMELTASLDSIRLGWLRLADERGAIVQAGSTSTAAWLRGALRVAPGAAGSQAQLAERLALPRCARTAEALAVGSISTPQAEVIARTLASLPDTLSDESMVAAESSLLDHATRLDPSQLRNVAQQLRAVLDPDTPLALARREFEQVDHRTFTLSDCGDGWTLVRGQLDAEGAELLRTALDPLCRPRAADESGRDPRAPAHRRADALIELARRSLAAGSAPESGERRPTLVVTMDYDQLVRQVGTARLPSGGRLSASAARRLACDAKIIPAVLGGASQPLDIGRSRRIVPRAMRTALVLRDQHCVNPSCHAPPEWCEAHHVVPWTRGGETKLDNLGLLCCRDHDRVHRGELLVLPRVGRSPTVLHVPPGRRRMV